MVADISLSARERESAAIWRQRGDLYQWPNVSRLQYIRPSLRTAGQQKRAGEQELAGG